MNKATRLNVASLGTVFGLSGIFHGFFESKQGNVPAKIGIINSVGELHKMWGHGDEPALTLIPNYMVSGILSMIVAVVLIVWSLKFVHKKNGPAVFLLLFITLLLVGGGVAQVIFFPFIWLVSTRIHKPLSWWKKILPPGLRKVLSALWPWLIGLSNVVMLFVLAVSFTGFVPGIHSEDTVLSIMFGCLLAVLVLFPASYIAGFSYDIEKMGGVNMREFA